MAAASLSATAQSPPKQTAPDGYQPRTAATNITKEWRLVWHEEFDAPGLDTTKWSKISRPQQGRSANWEKYLSPREELYEFKNGTITLWGRNTPAGDPDSLRFQTGGITTRGKFAFTYGKIEVRARFSDARGAWPALWMLCANSVNGPYPRSGEIDLMEHLNHDTVVYQTIHSHYTLRVPGGKDIPSGSVPAIRPGEFNTYGMEWYPDRIVFTVNGQATLTYLRRADAVARGQFPFDQPFFLHMDMQLEGGWVGPVSPEELPVSMEIDWVRVWQ